jgi:hypothetical protein
MNTCKDCGKLFGSMTNHRKRCFDCNNIHRKVTAKANKEKYQYHKKPEYRYKTYLRGAKSRGYSFEITLEEFIEFLNKPCKYCNSAIESRGLDRIDNAKGYTIDNINSCCSTCNFMKGKLTEELFINQCKQIANNT